MEVWIVRIILKNIGVASEKLYRKTLSTVREGFRRRVGYLESIFSHDGTSWRVLISCLKEKRQAQLGANHLAFHGGGGVWKIWKKYPAASQAKKKVQCMNSSNEKKNHVCMVHPKKNSYKS